MPQNLFRHGHLVIGNDSRRQRDGDLGLDLNINMEGGKGGQCPGHRFPGGRVFFIPDKKTKDRPPHPTCHLHCHAVY